MWKYTYIDTWITKMKIVALYPTHRYLYAMVHADTHM